MITPQQRLRMRRVVVRYMDDQGRIEHSEGLDLEQSQLRQVQREQGYFHADGYRMQSVRVRRRGGTIVMVPAVH